MGKSMPSTSLSTYFHPVIDNFTEKWLAETQARMGLIHQTEIFFFPYSLNIQST